MNPESILYLFFRDAFSSLHKYAYLSEFAVDEENDSVSQVLSTSPSQIHKHDGRRYCPWCDIDSPEAENRRRPGCECDVSESLFLLDDRLYDYLENYLTRHESAAEEWEGVRKKAEFRSLAAELYSASRYLVNCVRVSDCFRAFSDSVFVLRRPRHMISYPEWGQICDYGRRTVNEDENVKSELCRTLKQLLLPMDIVDSKAWVIPVILRSVPGIKSLGETFVYHGLKVAEDLDLIADLNLPTKLENINLSLEDFSANRVRASLMNRMNTLLTKHPHWSVFAYEKESSFQERLHLQWAPTLDEWIEDDLSEEVVREFQCEVIRERWKEQIEKICVYCPDLKHMRLSIQASVICGQKDIWGPLRELRYFCGLYVYSSRWSDVLGLLEFVGQKLTKLKIVLNSDQDGQRDVKINKVPFLCPKLKELFLGYIPGDAPHSICEQLPTLTAKPAFQNLTHFEATGTMTLDALQYLWQNAPLLESLKVSMMIVLPSQTSSFNEITFSNERILHLFELNPMTNLKVLDIPMTLTSISAAKSLLDLLPQDMRSVATLNVKVSIPESLEGESFGDLVSSVLARMASFKTDCLKRPGEIIWNWKREGILTILLQQQAMLSFSDLIDP